MSEPTNRREIELHRRLSRETKLDRAQISLEERTATLSYASEAPVERFYRGEVISEVIDIGESNFARMEDGAALLLNHDPDQQIGTVTESWVGKGADGMPAARAKVLFSRSDKGREVLQDVIDGVRGSTSVGYELLREVSRSETDGSPPVVRFAANFLECSLVAVPADAGVGVGRSTSANQPPKRETMSDEKKIPATPKEEPNIVDVEVRAAEEAIRVERDKQASAAKAADDALKAERQRTAAIDASAEQFADDYTGISALAQKAKREGHTPERFNAELLDAMADKANRGVELRELGLSKKEKREYSVVRALRCLCEGKAVDGLEGEISSVALERADRGPTPQAFTIPINMGLGAQKRAVGDTLTSGWAEEVYPDNHRGDQFIEFLRPNLLFETLGARVLSGIQGKINIPRQTASSAVVWQTESNATTVDELAVDDITLEPHEASVYTEFTRKLMSHSDPSIEALVRADITDALGEGLDTAWFEGNGTAKPLGVWSTTGIGTVSVSDASGPSYSEALSFESDVATANALKGSLAWVTTPAVRGVMRAAKIDTGSGQFVWGMDNTVIGYPAYATTLITASRTIFGNWGDYLAATFAPGLDVMIDPYSASTNRRVRILLNFMADGEGRHGASWSKSA